jgi:glycosyltransferase involved in cell wall biosynthesis
MIQAKVLIFIVAYNAEKTIQNVLDRINLNNSLYDIEILVIDDASDDKTFEEIKKISKNFTKFKLTTLRNRVNQGYGGNQKLGYQYAINNRFDFVVLLHGDGQYAPEFIKTLIKPLEKKGTDAVFGSRMLEKGSARKGGMPLYKFIGNKILSGIQNRLLGTKLSEFHSGYRAYSVKALSTIPFEYNSNDFHFDTQIIIQFISAKYNIEEIPIPTYYGDEICYVNGIKYGWNVVKSTLSYKFHKTGMFYQFIYDLEPLKAPYTSKLNYSSPHSKVLNKIKKNSIVFDIGCGPFEEIAKELTLKKECTVYALENYTPKNIKYFKKFFKLNLDINELPESVSKADYILLLDVLEHLKEPENFLLELRKKCNLNTKIYISVPNVAFIIVRLMLFFGIFNYGKEGILDKTHKRLFTYSSFKVILEQSGFMIKKLEGIPVPFEKAFGKNKKSRFLSEMNKMLIFLKKRLFSYQIFAEVSPFPVLQDILNDTLTVSKSQSAFLDRN